MTDRIAVVTGGAGFIGSHAVDSLLARGFSVRVVDDLSGGRLANLAHVLDGGRVAFHEVDICEIPADSPIFAGADLVLHFAGIGDIVPSVERPVEYMQTNVMGTVRVLEAARAAGVRRLVYSASSSCYGANPPVPTDEACPIVTEYPYALSKYLGEQAAFHWMRVYGLSVNSIRIFNAYGTRSRTSGAYGAVFGVFLKQKLAGKPFTVVGDGTQRRDFVYVTDVAEAFVRAALVMQDGMTWNLGSGDPQSVNRLVELLDGPVVHIPKRPGEPDATWADPRAINRDLDWRPTVSFEEGVTTVVENIDYWADAPLWDVESISRATRPWFDLLSKSETRG
ncbi:MAG: NAD-dependent epimerase/dehydratase family protein [Actinomycetota bacterium]|nr:NAD-dependent epimerase/dehydratase family protein [Actinomycetota bacterium]